MGLDARDYERVLGVGLESGDTCDVVRPARGDLVLADACGELGVVTGLCSDDHLVGTDRDELGLDGSRERHRPRPRSLARLLGARAAADAARQAPRAALQACSTGCETGRMHPLVQRLVGRGGRPDRRTRHGRDRREDRRDLVGRGVGRDRAQHGPASDGVAHRGMFPCLRDGICSRFVRSIARDRTSTRRVSRGSITSST